jgi:putative Mg2+ transporter-C (MgtC) family protein
VEPLFAFEWGEASALLLKLTIAFVLALPVGWERERSTVLMGLRTFPIVSLATCAYVLMAAGFAPDNPDAQARVVQGLITGMGFIGGGAILKDSGGVRGTATAASLWATGAIGASVAYGRLEIAVPVAVVLFLALHFLTSVEEKVGTRAEAGTKGTLE